jgi:hypothetical protein
MVKRKEATPNSLFSGKGFTISRGEKMKKIIMVLILAMILLFPLATFARDLVEFDVEEHIVWMNPVAWDTLNYDNKVQMIQDFGQTFSQKRNLYGYWTYKAMGTGAKLATFELYEGGARKIKILIN